MLAISFDDHAFATLEALADYCHVMYGGITQAAYDEGISRQDKAILRALCAFNPLTTPVVDGEVYLRED